MTRAIYATNLEPTPATALLASLRWPVGSSLEVLHAIPPRRDLLLRSRAPDAAMLATHRAQVSISTLALGETLRGQPVTLHDATRLGDPAEVIARRAGEVNADLVVVGAPRRDNFLKRDTVVSRLIERAPCSVLIARTAQLRRLLLADDASAGADRAATVVGRSPLLTDLPVVVVTVIDVITPIVVTPYGRYAEATELVHERAVARTRVDARVAELARRGRVVRGLVREGGPAGELLSVVRELEIDCVVLGPSATNFFDQILVGSVARALAADAECSVLIARVPGKETRSAQDAVDIAGESAI